MNSNLSSPPLTSPFTISLTLLRPHASLGQITLSDLLPQWTLCSMKEIRYWHRRIFIHSAHSSLPIQKPHSMTERRGFSFHYASISAYAVNLGLCFRQWKDLWFSSQGQLNTDFARYSMTNWHQCVILETPLKSRIKTFIWSIFYSQSFTTLQQVEIDNGACGCHSSQIHSGGLV